MNTPSKSGAWFQIDFDTNDPFVQWGRFLDDSLITLSGYGSELDWKVWDLSESRVTRSGTVSSFFHLTEALLRQHVIQ